MKTMIKIWAKIGEVVWKILAVLWILIDVIVGCVTMGLCFVVCNDGSLLCRVYNRELHQSVRKSVQIVLSGIVYYVQGGDDSR